MRSLYGGASDFWTSGAGIAKMRPVMRSPLMNRSPSRRSFVARSLGLAGSCFFAGAARGLVAAEWKLLDVRKIWDRAKHNAFTDLLHDGKNFYCCFREADKHVPGLDGGIRILVSSDGEKWESEILLEEPAVDLRDPKLSLTPDGRRMLLAGGSLYAPGPAAGKSRKRTGMRGRVFFSKAGGGWTSPQPISIEGEWLWRVTWHEGAAYGFSYDKGTALNLWKSKDGVEYEKVHEAKLPGESMGGETTIRFKPDGTAIALVRRDAKPRSTYFGESKAPYAAWKWRDLEHPIHGPNFLILPDGEMVYSGRVYEPQVKTTFGVLGAGKPEQKFELPSGGDTSYPGLVWRDETLWLSYYSSHEKKSAIYLAKLKRA
jgi:hypothetical protein